MTYRLFTTKTFDKSLKRCRRRGYDMEKLKRALVILLNEGKLPSSYKPHRLKGNHAGEWEAHISPDWLLVWLQDEDQLTLLLLDTGTHSDLF